MKNKICTLLLASAIIIGVSPSSIMARDTNNGNIKEQVKSYNLPYYDDMLEPYLTEDMQPINRYNENSPTITMGYGSWITKVWSKDIILRGVTSARYNDELRNVDEISVQATCYEKDRKNNSYDTSFTFSEVQNNMADAIVEKSLVFPRKYVKLYTRHVIKERGFEDLVKELSKEREFGIFKKN